MTKPFTLTGNHIILGDKLVLRIGSLEAEQIICNRIKVLGSELEQWRQLLSTNEEAIERELENKLYEDTEVVAEDAC